MPKTEIVFSEKTEKSFEHLKEQNKQTKKAISKAKKLLDKLKNAKE